jgi:hypothetical protein
LRSRVVALKGKWWTDGNAPLVPFRDKDNSPVALLPAKGKGYELFDPADLRTTKVSATVALTLNGFAHTFYRRLPDEKLGASALLSYGLRHSQRELSAILLMGIGSGLLSLGTPVATGILFNSIIPGAQRSVRLPILVFSERIVGSRQSPLGSRHGTRGTTRCMLRSRSAWEKCNASTESDGVSVMRMHLKTGVLLFAATLRTGTRTLVSG